MIHLDHFLVSHWNVNNVFSVLLTQKKSHLNFATKRSAQSLLIVYIAHYTKQKKSTVFILLYHYFSVWYCCWYRWPHGVFDCIFDQIDSMEITQQHSMRCRPHIFCKMSPQKKQQPKLAMLMFQAEINIECLAKWIHSEESESQKKAAI